jgi:hypothetical protein
VRSSFELSFGTFSSFLCFSASAFFKQRNEERAARLKKAEAEKHKKEEKVPKDSSKEDLTKVDS